MDSGDERDESLVQRFAPAREDNDEKDTNLLYGPVEAQWVLSTLDDMITKLNVCSYLTPNILSDKMIDAVDHELIIALKEHFQIEREYVAIQRKLDSQGILDEKDNMKELEECLSDSTRNVCRLLTGYQHNLIVVRRLRELCPKRSPSVREYLNTFQMLRKLVHEKLRVTAEDEHIDQVQLAELEHKQREDEAKYEELLSKLKKEQKEHTENILLKERKINRLKEQIELLDSETETRRINFKLAMEREDLEAKAKFDNDKQALMANLKEMGAKLNKQVADNTDNEKRFHGKNASHAVRVLGTIERYDTEMREQHDKLNELEERYARELEECNRLAQHFQQFDEENQRVVDSMVEIRERRDRILLAERKRNHAALQVQQLFQGFQARHVKDLSNTKSDGDKKDKKK